MEAVESGVEPQQSQVESENTQSGGTNDKRMRCVWAKVPGHPFWPCIVSEGAKRPRGVTDSKICVFFFFDQSYAWVAENATLPYTVGGERPTKSTSQRVISAIAEADNYIANGVLTFSIVPIDEDEEKRKAAAEREEKKLRASLPNPEREAEKRREKRRAVMRKLGLIAPLAV